MKTWTVKSKGRLEKIIIFYFFLSLLITLILLYSVRRSHGEVGSMNSDDVFFFFLIFSPIWIPLLVVTLKKLLSSRIPKQITFDDQQRLIIEYSKREHNSIPLDQLAYSHSDLTGNHISITFYNTFVGSRGQLVYKEVIQIIGLRWSFSWRTSHIKEMINYSKELGINKKSSSNERLSLFDKISS